MKIAVLSLLPLLWFAVPQDPKTLSLTTVTGDAVTAQVLEQKGDTAKLKVSILGGNMTVVRKLSDFTPISVFRIEMAAKAPADFAGHFAMAKRAAARTCTPRLVRARTHARIAACLAPFDSPPSRCSCARRCPHKSPPPTLRANRRASVSC